MKFIYERYKNLPRRMKIEAIVAMMITLISMVAIPVLAWFSNERKMGDLERVDTPTRLFITAAQKDDIKYLQLTDIKVSDSSEKKKYYVFCVSGKSTNYYNLQLAYTTNNQFEYFLYPAHQLTSAELNSIDLNSIDPLVEYTAHDDNGEESDTYYYSIEKSSDIVIPASDTPYTGNEAYRLWSEVSGSEEQGKMQIRHSKITTRFLNKDSESLIADSSKHNSTYNYKNYDADGAENVGAQLYCEPIYWQALKIKTSMNEKNELEDYYILEVNWEKAYKAAGAAGLKDDRETDIIYIAAQATS